MQSLSKDANLFINNIDDSVTEEEFDNHFKMHYHGVFSTSLKVNKD